MSTGSSKHYEQRDKERMFFLLWFSLEANIILEKVR